MLYTAPVMFEALTMRARFAIGSSSSDTAELPAEERRRGREGGMERGRDGERGGGRFAKVSYTRERKGRERAHREREKESSKVSVITAVAMKRIRSHSISSCDWDGSER